MSDDLVQRLRKGVMCGDDPIVDEAADRIKKLEEENGVLFAANVRLNSRADLDCDHYRDRIKKLEAALVKVAGGYEIEWSKSSVINMLKVAEILSERIVIAQKALEGKDD
jgi:hypothetical protein